MSIKVSIVDDSPGVRESFALALNGSANLRCLGAYKSGEEALREIPVNPPDVVLMDIHLPGMTGITCVGRLRVLLPKLQILMLTRFEESDTIFQALRAGASGYLVKNIPPAEMILAIEQVHAGGAPMSMQIARKVITHFQAIPKPPDGIDSLTLREQEVLQLLAKGRLQKNIATTLGISVNTLRTHLRSIYEKLHVHSRSEAMLKLLDPHRSE
jgi:DNA-binding NarL/FixJ family response regulator